MVAGRCPDFLSRRSVKASPPALCLSLERLGDSSEVDSCVCWWSSPAGVEGKEEEGDMAARERQEGARFFLSVSSLKLIPNSLC